MHVEVRADGKVLLATTVALNAAEPVSVAWQKPDALVTITITANGKTIASYTEEKPDQLKSRPSRTRCRWQLRCSRQTSFTWQDSTLSNTATPRSCRTLISSRGSSATRSTPGACSVWRHTATGWRAFPRRRNYARRAIKRLTKFNARIPSGDAYYQLGLILEAEGKTGEAYDYYRQAAWVGSSVSKAMTRTPASIWRGSDYEEAIAHAKQVLTHDAKNPLAPVVLALSYRALGENRKKLTT